MPKAFPDCETRDASTPRNVKLGKCIGAGQDVFMTVEPRAVEAPCRRLTGDTKLLESQFLHDAAASVVAVEVPDADRLGAKAAERVTNCGVGSLRGHALSGIFPRHPITGLIDVRLISRIQRGSDDEISVNPMESGQCDTCLTLEFHRPSNGVFQRLPRPLVLERPSHPKLQTFQASSLAAWIASKSSRVGGRKTRCGVTMGIKWRIERLNCNGRCLGAGMATAVLTEFGKFEPIVAPALRPEGGVKLGSR